MAQVYSVNAVGYVNLTVPKGKFALFVNPLVGSNTINALFPVASAPGGAFLYTIGPSGFIVTQNDSFGAGWLDEMGAAAGDTRSISNGQAFLMWNPDPTTDYVITFVGEVPQGSVATGNPVVNDVPINFSMRGSKVPQAGLIQSQLGYPAPPGILLQKFNVASQSFEVYTTDSFAATDPVNPATDWYDPMGAQVEPTVAVGEGFILYQPVGARNWTRDFSVN
jgi:hypothetical protein